MIAFFIAPVYLVVIGYLFWRLTRWLGDCHEVFRRRWVRVVLGGLLFLVAFSMIPSLWKLPGEWNRFFKAIENGWLGFLLYTLLFVGGADLIRLLVKLGCRVTARDFSRFQTRKTHLAVGALCIVLILAMGTYGMVNARIVRTTEYDITVDRGDSTLEDLNVVLIADLHLGYSVGAGQMERMVDKINAARPDVVVIAGDIFDNDFDAIGDPDRVAEVLRGIQSKYGVFACYGNHDIKEKILTGFTFDSDAKKVSDPRMDAFLAEANITLLRDEAVLIDDQFYLYGRPDAKHVGRGIDQRKTPAELMESMKKDLPVLVLDHQPSELEELAAAGVDVDLCGHTHDGQVFPGNLTINLLWDNACGYLRVGEMHNIVTSGVGVFGPSMRTGTKAEICRIHITLEG